MRIRSLATSITALLGAAACSDDAPGTPDADPDAPDAGRCGARLDLTGGYQDWDSSLQSFAGIFDAVVTEVADPANTARTAPNGRSSLCLPRTGPSQVTFTQTAAGYLPGRYTVEPAAVADLYELRGIKTTRIASFYTELGDLTWDPATALVEVEVRGGPGNRPVEGVSIAIGGGTGGFHQDAAGAWSAGATTAGGRYVIYPNVAIPGGGALTLEVLAPGKTCKFPATLHVAAGEVAMTTVTCDD